jgi:hypothetical protein
MIFDRTKRHHVAGLFAPRERVRFKSTPSVPTPAAPQTVATAQTGSNVDTAIANATLGNVNQNGPFGSTTYNQTGGQMVDGNFVPSFTQNTSLNPTLQSILSGTENTANNLVPVGNQIAGNIQPNGANNQIIQGGPQALYQPVTNQVFQGEEALLQPGQQLAQTQLQDQLSMQGIPLGSQAYNSATTNLNTNQAAANVAAAGNAAGIGAQTSGNMFNLALLGAQAPINQLQSLYGATGTA